MKVISIRMLREFWQHSPHADAEQPLKAWFDEAKKADWKTPQDVKAKYASASIIKNNRVVFNIKGNDYRLVVAIAYKLQIVYIKFIDTHAVYDTIDVTTVDRS